jgi:hypothetical protein
MFGPLKANGKTTEIRYEQRKRIWRDYAGQMSYLTKSQVKFPALQHRFHWLLHNIPIHILIGLFPCKTTFKLHDWSSDRLNALHYHMTS